MDDISRQIVLAIVMKILCPNAFVLFTLL